MQRFEALTAEAKQLVIGLNRLETRQEWPRRTAVPPASLLSDVLDAFEAQTDIPLELPYAYLMAYLSGFLCTKRVTLQITRNQTISPQLFLTTLAPSSSAKTTVGTFIKRWIAQSIDKSPVPLLGQPGSAAKFIEDLQHTPRGLWIRDEFGKFLQSIDTQPHQQEMKDHLLNAYSNERLEKRTLKGDIVVDDYAFAFLGLTVDTTFPDEVGHDSIVDGFAQRFLYIIAAPDETRSPSDFPLYFADHTHGEEDDAREQRIYRKFTDLFTRSDLEGATLTFSKEAIHLFERTFKSEYSRSFPTSFYRRIMFATFRYAAIYHLLRKAHGTEIDEASLAYATRAVRIHLQDARTLLTMCGWSELERVIQQCEAYRERYFAKHNTLPDARDYVSGVRAIQSSAQARDVISLMRTFPKQEQNAQGRCLQ